MPIVFFGAGVWHTNGARGMQKYTFKQPLFFRHPLQVMPCLAEQRFSKYEAYSCSASKGRQSGSVRDWLALWVRCANGLIGCSYFAPAPLGVDVARPWPMGAEGLLLKLSEHIDEIDQHADGYTMQSFAAVGRWHLAEYESFSDEQIVSAMGMVRAWQAINILLDGFIYAHSPNVSNPILAGLGGYYSITNQGAITELDDVQNIALKYANKAKQLIGLVDSCSWIQHDTVQDTLKQSRLGQSEGGKKSGENRRQDNAERDKEICRAYLDTPPEQRRYFTGKESNKRGVTAKTIRDILKNGGVWRSQNTARPVTANSSTLRN